MNKYSKQLATLFVLVMSAHTTNANDDRHQHNAKELNSAFAIIEQAVNEGEVPGAIAMVAKEGEITRQQPFGVCDIERQRPMQVDTICWLASITKPITVATAMKLVESGQISLDDTVEQYLPEFKNQKAADGNHYPITIRQLMSHSSGIPPRPPVRPREFFEPGWLGRQLREIPPAVAELELEFKPGSQVHYSNAAPYVLGRIVEIRSGKPFQEMVQRSILDPLEMGDTYFALPASKEERIAVVSRRRQGVTDTFFRFDSSWNVKMAMPDGGLFAPPGDVAKFVQMFLVNDGSVLSKQSVGQMLTVQAPGWGLGWSLDDDGSFEHTGSAGTLCWGDPANNVVGVLFFQIQDQQTVQRLRDEFRTAVANAIPQDAGNSSGRGS